MSKITINIIQARLRAIYDSIPDPFSNEMKNETDTLIQVTKKLEELMNEIQEYKQEESTEDKSLEESILRSKAWIVTEDAIVAFTCSGKFHVLVDGQPLMEGRYLGKKRSKEMTWYGWIKERHGEEING